MLSARLISGTALPFNILGQDLNVEKEGLMLRIERCFCLKVPGIILSSNSAMMERL